MSRLVRILPGSKAVRSLATASIAALSLSVSSASLQTVVANGDTRSLSFAHIHTGETLSVTFKRQGRYDEAALKQINWFLRDWRRDEAIAMDPHTIDIVWEIHREAGAPGPVTIISGFRSPQTNSMLRARGRGVARYSQHMLGKAIDFYIPGTDLATMRAIGLRLQRGGVGFYPSSGSPFIHVDSGSVRHWPRMTRDQLARIFPDGKTVHLPTDGKPMRGYAVALAEIESRGSRAAPIALASLDEDSDERAASPRSTRSRIPTNAVLTSTAPSIENSPPAVARPVLASLSPSPRATDARQAIVAALTPAATPMPSPRPHDLGDVTASVPRGQVMAYAAAPERHLPAFGPIPATHARILHLPEQGRPPQTIRAVQEVADAALAPVSLFSMRGIEFMGELQHPDLYSLRGLTMPARAALDLQFTGGTVEAPSSGRFSGRAVVALHTLAFDRGAGIVTGRVARAN
ncbi:MAG: DUF882 domain-containing protein [Bradyrhizobiaceae bacterium]|nr:DUF882 domain-containing protein [Bradyrhizobiaceae bacterium]